MSRKRVKISTTVRQFEGEDLDPRYLEYFERFNRQLFFEAHEVLEELWLPQRGGPKAAFYQGLIQLAGAFVHVQKRRPGPAAALFRLARSNLVKYPARYEALEIAKVQELIENWLYQIEQGRVDYEELRSPKLFVGTGCPNSSAVPALTQKSTGVGLVARGSESQESDPLKL